MNNYSMYMASFSAGASAITNTGKTNSGWIIDPATLAPVPVFSPSYLSFLKELSQFDALDTINNSYSKTIILDTIISGMDLSGLTSANIKTYINLVYSEYENALNAPLVLDKNNISFIENAKLNDIVTTINSVYSTANNTTIMDAINNTDLSSYTLATIDDAIEVVLNKLKGISGPSTGPIITSDYSNFEAKISHKNIKIGPRQTVMIDPIDFILLGTTDIDDIEIYFKDAPGSSFISNNIDSSANAVTFTDAKTNQNIHVRKTFAQSSMVTITLDSDVQLTGSVSFILAFKNNQYIDDNHITTTNEILGYWEILINLDPANTVLASNTPQTHDLTIYIDYPNRIINESSSQIFLPTVFPNITGNWQIQSLSNRLPAQRTFNGTAFGVLPIKETESEKSIGGYYVNSYNPHILLNYGAFDGNLLVNKVLRVDAFTREFDTDTIADLIYNITFKRRA